MPEKIDLDIIQNELMILPEFYNQICLQGIKEFSDPFFGCGSGNLTAAGKVASFAPYKEEDFKYPNFDLPYTNSLIEKLNIYRTRVLILHPNSCYSIHSDNNKRIHIPIVTDEKCWLIIDKEVIHLPADGNYYEIDTTKQHTALNGSRTTKRIHIVGCL